MLRSSQVGLYGCRLFRSKQFMTETERRFCFCYLLETPSPRLHATLLLVAALVASVNLPTDLQHGLCCLFHLFVL
jgi:hypothetical protein